MKQKELEDLIKDIKTEFARKVKFGFVMGIVYGLLCLAAIIVYCFLTECDSSELLFLSGIFLVISFEKFLFSVKNKNIMKAENAEELLSRYDAYTTYTNKLGKFLPFITVSALFIIGYVIYHMITEINIERFGVVLFWLIMAFLVLCFIFIFLVLCFIFKLTMIIPMKENVKNIGRKDDAIERLRELVANEQRDTL